MRCFGSGRVAALVLSFCAACGGKAEKDGPILDAPSAGASGTAAASGGSGGTSPTAKGGAPAASGGVVAAGGATAAGGVNATGGTAGVASGGQATATGGAAPRPEPGTELWFSRGYAILSGVAYRELLFGEFSLPAPARGTAESWDTFGFTPAPPSVDALTPAYLASEFLADVSDEQLLDGLGCSAADARCAEFTANRFARHMWRRAVTPEESAALMTMFSDAAPGSEVAALRAILDRILRAPDAYTLPLQGTEVAPGRYELSDTELAGLLAMAITGRPPDDALLDSATQGALDLDAELERLLESDAARDRMDLLIRKWFYLRNAEELWVYQEDPALAESMLGETRRFIDNVVFDEPAPVSSLVTAPFSFVNARLVELYGVGSASGTEFERVDLGATRRRGIPGQASFLTSTSLETRPSYVERAYVPLRLICEDLPPAPPDVSPPPPPPVLGSRRAQFDALTAGASCAGCHRVMNPIAYSFEHFDERGAYIDTDPNGFPVDSSGSITTFSGLPLEFDDSADLMERIAKMPAFSECFVRNAVGWLVGLGNADPAVLDYVARGHEPGDDEEVLAAIRRFVSSDHFRFRKQ